jgi:hypothetical protein
MRSNSDYLPPTPELHIGFDFASHRRRESSDPVTRLVALLSSHQIRAVNALAFMRSPCRTNTEGPVQQKYTRRQKRSNDYRKIITD